MKREIRHKHSLGQNFITDDKLFARLVELSGVGQDDCVLEIGAGAGGLTKALSERCREVIAIEVDGALIPLLREFAETRCDWKFAMRHVVEYLEKYKK